MGTLKRRSGRKAAHAMKDAMKFSSNSMVGDASLG